MASNSGPTMIPGGSYPPLSEEQREQSLKEFKRLQEAQRPQVLPARAAVAKPQQQPLQPQGAQPQPQSGQQNQQPRPPLPQRQRVGQAASRRRQQRFLPHERQSRS